MSEITNKVVTVPLTGGIIGLVTGSTKKSLETVIARENARGWKVVEVLRAANANMIMRILQLLVLFCTFFFYTFSDGYYVVFKKVG